MTKVIRLFSRVSPTSSPYVQFTLAFTRVESQIEPFFLDHPNKNDRHKYLSYIAYLRRVVSFARSNTQFRVIHCHNAYLLPVAVIAKLLVPSVRNVVFTLHTSYGLLKWRDKSILYFFRSTVDWIVACGKSVGASFPPVYQAASNFRVIRNGVNLPKLKPRTKQHFGSGVLRIYTAGRLVSGKAISQCISVLSELHMPKGTLELNIFGTGPELLPLQKLARTQDALSVRFHGQVARSVLYEEMQDMDFYISTSKGEGLPVAAIEALCAGIPAILSDIDAHRELSVEFPEYSFLLDNSKIALEQFLKKDWSRVSLNQDAINGFGIPTMESQYLEVYNSHPSESNEHHIARVFSKKARQYDNHYREAEQTRYSIEKRWRKRIALDHVRDCFRTRVGKMLDVGCGTGSLVRDVASISGVESCAGYDISNEMISRAIEQNNEVTPITFTSDWREVKDENYAVVSSLGVVGYQSSQLEFLKQLSDVTLPGGLIIVSIGNGDSFIRRIYDHLRVSTGRRRLIYRHTSHITLEHWLSHANAQIEAEYLLLPCIPFVPPMVSKLRWPTLASVYFTKVLVIRIGDEKAS